MAKLDYELELGIFVGPGNAPGMAFEYCQRFERPLNGISIA
jgi:hypothetical protein